MGLKYDLTGKTFGLWTILNRSDNRSGDTKWVCKCECGTIRDINSQNLRLGKSRSCGCVSTSFKDLTNQVFGLWTVIERVENSSRGHNTKYFCRCKCGTERIIFGGILKRGMTKSCGCVTNRFQDLTGQKIGFWKVIKRTGNKKWLCECECGIKRNVSLRAKNGSRSCGCDGRIPNLIGTKQGRLTILGYVENTTKYDCICDCGEKLEIQRNRVTSGHVISCGCWKGQHMEGSNNWRWVSGPKYTSYDHRAEKLQFAEPVRRDPNNAKVLQVRCSLCKKWFNPTSKQASRRISFLYGNSSCEGRFYCSTKCKSQCPIFGQILWPKDYNQNDKRLDQPDWREMILARDGYECQMCGAKESLEAHHYEGIWRNPIESADVDNGIILCTRCHRTMVYSQVGCKPYEMRRVGC